MAYVLTGVVIAIILGIVVRAALKRRLPLNAESTITQDASNATGPTDRVHPNCEPEKFRERISRGSGR